MSAVPASLSASTDTRHPQDAAGRPRSKSETKLKVAKVKGNYLLAYNTLSAVLWSVVFVRTVMQVAEDGGSFENVYESIGDFTKWTQTLATMEILHSAIGLVRSPIITTFVQVVSRLNLVWPILHVLPQSMRTSPAYTSMITAWSITEIVRYSYYALNLSDGVPAYLIWLRYNLFFILYPVGIASEAWELFGSLDEAKDTNQMLYYYELFVLYALYVPGAYVMYTHMMKQRRKIMRGKRPARR